MRNLAVDSHDDPDQIRVLRRACTWSVLAPVSKRSVDSRHRRLVLLRKELKYNFINFIAACIFKIIIIIIIIIMALLITVSIGLSSKVLRQLIGFSLGCCVIHIVGNSRKGQVANWDHEGKFWASRWCLESRAEDKKKTLISYTVSNINKNFYI